MKKVLLPILLGLTIVSCKTTKHTDCDAYSKLETTQKGYTMEMVEKNQSEDAKYIRENWTQEQIDYFTKNYVYKTIIINGDTLK